jgi:hypothetical protein
MTVISLLSCVPSTSASSSPISALSSPRASFFGRRQKTTRRYFLAGHDVPWWAIAASIVATETSTITFISVPGIAWARRR